MPTTFPLDAWGMHGADDTYPIKIAQSTAPGARELPIKLSTADDGQEVKRTIANDDGFIADSSNFALFNCIGTQMIRGHATEGDRVWHTAFSPFWGAPSIPRKNMRNFSNIRASDADEAQLLVQHLATVDIKRIAIVDQNNLFGKDVFLAKQQGYGPLQAAGHSHSHSHSHGDGGELFV